MKRFLGSLLTAFLVYLLYAPIFATFLFGVDNIGLSVLTGVAIGVLFFISVFEINNFVNKHLEIQP